MKYSIRAMMLVTAWLGVACAALALSPQHAWIFDVYMLFALLAVVTVIASTLATDSFSKGWRIGFSATTLSMLILFYSDIPFFVDTCSRIADFACFDLAGIHERSTLSATLLHFRVMHLIAIHLALGFGALSGMVSNWLVIARMSAPNEEP